MNEDDGNGVGYGKPPKHTRFRKGRSGNPKGRPRRARDVATLSLNLLNETRLVAVGKGKRRRMSEREVMLRTIYDDALNGDAWATKTVFRWMQEYDEKYLKIDPVFDGPLFSREELERKYGGTPERFSDPDESIP